MTITNSMKALFVAGFVLFASFMFAMPASAATNMTFVTLDGLSNATAEVGSTVDAKVTFEISANDDVESMSWELVGSGLPETCVNIADRIVDGTFNASFPIDTTGATEGTWDVRVKAFGLNGTGADNNCGDSADDTFTSTNSLTITEEANNSGGTANNTGNSGNGNNGGSGLPSWLAYLIAALKPTQATSTVPTVSATCVAYTQANTGTQMNVYNDANVRLQGFLLSQGASIPALKAGASFGFFGNQTFAAVQWFQGMNHCQ